MISKWQPIETAPRDGSYVLIHNALGNTHVAHWSRRFLGDHDIEGWCCERKKVARPTHWMPLPGPPET